MLERASTAERTKAVIQGSVVNQDGRSSGLTAPNGHAQTKLIVAALEVASITSESVASVAMHGTGTPLGDPIEVNALNKAFTSNTMESFVLTLLSIKSCFGHTEGTAGLTGMSSNKLVLIARALLIEKS